MTAAYIKDRNNRHKLIVDSDATEVVRRIFKMASEGAGYNKIARTLRAEGVLNPISYCKQQHPDYDKQGHFEMQCQWHVTSVQKILENPVYLGCLAHGKVGTKGIKGKRVKKDEDDWIVVNDTHEVIVEMETWMLVKSHFSKKRRERKTGETQMFAGLLYCSDCGSALSFSTVKRKTKSDGGQYKFWYYMRHGKEAQDMIKLIAQEKKLSVTEAVQFVITPDFYRRALETGWGVHALPF